MKTRSSLKVYRDKQRENERLAAEAVAEAEKRKIENEKWVAEGTVINPLVPDPSARNLEIWKTFIISAYHHPNLLVHPDVKIIQDLFQFLGKFITYETSDLLIELEENEISEDDEDLHILKPFIPSPSQLLFCQIHEFEMIPELNAIIVRKYSVMEHVKIALSDLVEFISFFPEVLYYPQYAFIHDFFIHFGVLSTSMTLEIFETQLRRASAKYPASTLLLKQGVPEKDDPQPEPDKMMTSFNIDWNDFVNAEACDGFYDHNNSFDDSMMEDLKSGSISGEEGDSGIGMDYSPSSGSSDTDDVSTKEEPAVVVYARKSIQPFVQDIPVIKQKKLEDRNRINHVQNTPVKPVIKQKKLKKFEGRVDYDLQDKLYKCPQCGQRYAFRGNCVRHISTAHPTAQIIPVREQPDEKLFSTSIVSSAVTCPFCNEVFKTLSICKSHISKRHPDSSKTPNSSKMKGIKPQGRPPKSFSIPSTSRGMIYKDVKLLPENPYVLLMPLKVSKPQSKYVFKKTYKKRKQNSGNIRSSVKPKTLFPKEVTALIMKSPIKRGLRNIPVELF